MTSRHLGRFVAFIVAIWGAATVVPLEAQIILQDTFEDVEINPANDLQGDINFNLPGGTRQEGGLVETTYTVGGFFPELDIQEGPFKGIPGLDPSGDDLNNWALVRTAAISGPGGESNTYMHFDADFSQQLEGNAYSIGYVGRHDQFPDAGPSFFATMIGGSDMADDAKDASVDFAVLLMPDDGDWEIYADGVQVVASGLTEFGIDTGIRSGVFFTPSVQIDESGASPTATVSVVTPPPPSTADFDDDGDVDGADLALFEASFGVDDGADADGDSDTDGADFVIWQRDLGGPAGDIVVDLGTFDFDFDSGETERRFSLAANQDPSNSGLAQLSDWRIDNVQIELQTAISIGAIPEPTTALLALTALAVLAADRRGRRPAWSNA